jgi:hypothetical protein
MKCYHALSPTTEIKVLNESFSIKKASRLDSWRPLALYRH